MDSLFLKTCIFCIFVKTATVFLFLLLFTACGPSTFYMFFLQLKIYKNIGGNVEEELWHPVISKDSPTSGFRGSRGSAAVAATAPSAAAAPSASASPYAAAAPSAAACQNALLIFW